jgi:opacity protein-like surface antigen
LATAQGQAPLEIAPFAGYRFGGGVTDAYSGGTASLDGARVLGVMVDVPIRRGAVLEMLFSRQDTGVTLERYPERERFGLTIDHWMAGVRAEFPTEGTRVHPFLAGYVGLTHFSGDSGEITADTRFTAALGGGVALDVSEHLAVRLDARVYAVFVSSGAGLLCAGGCTATFGGGAMLQGETAASLVFKF